MDRGLFGAVVRGTLDEAWLRGVLPGTAPAGSRRKFVDRDRGWSTFVEKDRVLGLVRTRDWPIGFTWGVPGYRRLACQYGNAMGGSSRLRRAEL